MDTNGERLKGKATTRAANPKYDIREWNEDHTHLTRGITLKPAEMDRIVDLIYKRGKEKANEVQD